MTDIETQCFLFGVSLSQDQLSALLRANPEVARRTARLSDKQQRLQKALELFTRLAPEVPPSVARRARRLSEEEAEGRED